MSTIIAAVQGFSFVTALELALVACVAFGLLVLFQPLLRGVARALMLVVKPKLSKEERMQRRQMRDALALNRMLSSMEGSHSHTAELRAMATRA